MAQKKIDIVGGFLTRAVTPEQINANQGQGTLVRAYEVENINVEERTVELAFSSETPVMRWFGEEVLSHEPGAIVTDRLDSGAALLVDHDWRDLVGVVESHRIDDDRIARAIVRFGTSARAEEIWQDVMSGIRRHVSVGYAVRKVLIEEREGQADLVTLTEWEPYEISLVSVPADMSVGVGRSVAEPPEEADPSPDNTPNNENRNSSTEGSDQMKTVNIRNARGDLVRAKVDDDGNIVEELEVLERASATAARVTEGQDAERARTAALLELGRQYDAPDLAASHIAGGNTVDEMTRALLDHVRPDAAGGNRALSDDGGQIGMTANETGQYSFVRAIRALANPNDRRLQEAASFEFEASQAAADQLGRDARGLIVPMDVMQRAMNTGTDGAASGATGGLVIATDLMSQSFIDMLRNNSVLLGLVTPMGGLTGNVEIPGQLSGASGYWLDEDEDAGEGTQELRQISMSPKTCGVFTEATRRFLMQTSVAGEAFLRRDIAKALALTIDKAGFYGTGTDKQPLGVSNLSAINAVSLAAVNPTHQELVKMETEIAADNADVGSMAYLANARFRGHAKTSEKFQGTSGQTIWEPGGTVNGYRVEITNQIDNGDHFFGNWADMIAGMWGGLDITVDPYSNSKKGRIRIVAFQDIDFAYRHKESFCVARN